MHDTNELPGFIALYNDVRSALLTYAHRFYQQRGMRIAAIHRGAIAESRKLKPETAFTGIGGRPIEHEVEFELRL